MMMFQGFLTKHSLKMILIAKLLVIGYIFYDNGFYFGDKDITAQESKPIDSADESLTEEEDEGNRRSYIEDLLTLPNLNKEGVSKEEISRYLKIVDRKTRQAVDRISILEKRESHLKSLESSIDKKIVKLEEEISYLKATLQKEKEISDKRLDSLVSFYEKMTPKKAAPVFEQMDRDLVVALFNRIPKKQTMNILSLMNPQKSVELTEYYGRIRSGKEYELLKEINTSLRKEFSECKGLPEESP